MQTYFAVMSNMLHSTIFMNKLYDLKGSPKGRTNKKIAVRNNTVLKDIDLDFCFYVDPVARHRIIKYVSLILILVHQFCDSNAQNKCCHCHLQANKARL